MAGLALFVRTLLALRSSRRAALVALVVMGLGAGLASFFVFPVVDTVLSSEKLGQQGAGAIRGSATAGPGGPASWTPPRRASSARRSAARSTAPPRLHWLAEGSGGLLCLVFALGGLVAFGARGDLPSAS